MIKQGFVWKILPLFIILSLSSKSRERGILIEGYRIPLNETRVGAAWIRRMPMHPNRNHALFRKWQMQVSTKDRLDYPVLFVGDTLHLPTGDWKLRMCFKGIKRNKALMVKLRQKAID